MGLPNSSGGEPVTAGGSNAGGSGGRPVHVTMPSRLEAVRDVQDRIMAEVVRCGFDVHGQFAIRLSLEEGLVNAVKHGNRFDEAKHVQVDYLITPGELDISIEDEGAGFDRSGVPDPTLEENIEKCSGRGLLLIESYMTSVTYSRGGRRLRMLKRNGPEA